MSAEDTIAEIEARRAARKAKLAAEEAEQKARDLEALDALELEHGDSNISHLPVPFTPGLPTLAAVRTPTDAETRRFRDRQKARKGQEGDALKAAIELGAVCREYPDADTYARMLAARPGIDVQLGLLAARLAAGRIEDEGKG